MAGLDGLVDAFAGNVAAQAEAIRRGDPAAGNRHARKYVRAFQQLRDRGDEGREALVPLLRDERDHVRGMAAAFLLRYRTAQAREVLEQLAKGKGLAALGASEALARWRDGTWQLDPG